MRHLIALSAVLALAGCGGSGGTGDLGDALSVATADYAILDLNAKTYVYSATAPAVTTDPAFRSSKIVFRRIQVGSKDVFVAVLELTQAQWQLIDGVTSTPWTDVDSEVCSASAQSGDHPAYNLDYSAVTSALLAFDLANGARLTVPTGAQWEAACGTAAGWSWGDTATPAQLDANAVVRESVITASRLRPGNVYQDGADTGGPLAVGSRAPNALGFYDMHGNVWELTSPGAEVRGGSWRDCAWMSRAEIKVGASEGVDSQLEHALVGVRLVLVP